MNFFCELFEHSRYCRWQWKMQKFAISIDRSMVAMLTEVPRHLTNKDNEMLFALLILMILITSASMWHGNALTTLLFMATAICTLTVLVADIDTPLRLAF